mmetsp:Transcript_26334/g.64184  ORF Transcript_26334/g.64184 Transcript_26334/m.64184 type:complete len:130 (-) Transcript_26334:565-954(-)
MFCPIKGRKDGNETWSFRPHQFLASSQSLFSNQTSLSQLPSIFPSMRQPEIFGFFGLFFFDLQMTADAHQQFQNKWVWDGHTKSPKQQLTNILDLDRFCWHMVMFCGVPTCNNSLSHPSPRRICQKQKN